MVRLSRPAAAQGLRLPRHGESPTDGVTETVVMDKPFGALVKFSSELLGERSGQRSGRRRANLGQRRILLVAPLSGHFAFLLRDMVAGLAPTPSVYVTDWVNARHAPLERGRLRLLRQHRVCA